MVSARSSTVMGWKEKTKTFTRAIARARLKDPVKKQLATQHSTPAAHLPSLRPSQCFVLIKQSLFSKKKGQLASLMAQNPSRAQVVILQQELRYQANIERGESQRKAEFKKAEEQFDSCFANLPCKFSIC